MKTACAAVPAKMGTVETRQIMDAPSLGEHSSEILKSLNYKDTDIQAFLERKIIVQKTKPVKTDIQAFLERKVIEQKTEPVK